jgi:hypothetical protein
MSEKKTIFTPRQLMFDAMFVGTLIYAVVLGFFNDYTSIVQANSFSTIFFASVVLQILTYYTFALKKLLLARLKDREGAWYTLLRFFCLWLIMFLSKFVFVWVIDLIFGDAINIYGFFGILAVVASATVIAKLADYIFARLGAKS